MSLPIKPMYSPPTSTNYQTEPGYHSSSYVNLKDKHFSSPISSGSYMKLTNVTAPSIKSGSYVTLDQCQINNIDTNSYCKCSNTEIIGTLSSKQYVNLKNDCSVQNINANSYVKVKGKSTVHQIRSSYYVTVENSTVDHINSKSYVKLSEGAKVHHVNSDYYVDVKGKSEFAYLKANSYVKIKNSTGTQLESGSYVNAKQSTVSSVTAKDYTGNDSKHDSLNITDGVSLNNCTVFEKTNATEIRAANCELLGDLIGKEEVIADSCVSIKSIQTEFLTMKRCNVQGDVTSISSKISGSTVQGILTTSDQELRVAESYVNKLVMKKGQATFSEIDGVKVPPKISSLVKAIRTGAVSISNDGENYTIKLKGSSSSSSSSSSINYFGGGRNGGTVICNNSSSISFGNLVVDGNVSISAGNISLGNCNGNISLGNSSGSMKINGINVTGSGFSIKKGFLTKGDLKIPFNKEAIKNALEFIENWEIYAKESAESSEKKAQTVIVSGGHIEEVIFEEAGGQIITLNGGTVGKVLNGTFEKSAVVEEKDEREVADVPVEFECPVSLELMKNPYKTPFGHSFEYETLLHIVDAATEKVKCPLTRQEFSLKECTKDEELLGKINKWLKNHKPRM